MPGERGASLWLQCGLALERANSKFERRFRIVEQKVREQGKDLKDVGLEGQQQIWKEAKAEVKSSASK